jgi:hypothetical protein
MAQRKAKFCIEFLKNSRNLLSQRESIKNISNLATRKYQKLNYLDVSSELITVQLSQNAEF